MRKAEPHTGAKSRSREAAALQAQLFRAEEAFRVLVENLPDIVTRFGPDLRHLYVSSAARSMTGMPSPQYVGQTNRELGLPSELARPWDAAVRGVFATGRPQRLDLELPAPGGRRYFECRLLPEADAEGTVLSVLSVARDVTDLRRTREAEQRAHDLAGALCEATVALNRSLDSETVLETLLDRLRRIVPFDRARVMLIDETARISVWAIVDGDRVVTPAPDRRPELSRTDHPLLDKVLTTGKAALIPDVRAQPGWSLPADGLPAVSWMGVPLFGRGGVAGLFSLSKTGPGGFDEEHLRLAEAMSSQASVAVENAFLFDQTQATTRRMQSLARRLVEVQECERRHIARELHDEAGQALASLRYGLRLLEKDVAEGGSVSKRVEELTRRVDTVIDGLRCLAADLRPATLDHLGLEAALRQFSRSAGSKFGLAVRFKARGFTHKRLPAAVETALYRVVQEAMTNVVRHARANRVDVLAEQRRGGVLVMVEDDGVGFELDQVQRGNHFGLLGLRERAEALGGTLTLESAPGAGTTVVVEVPSAEPHPDR